MPLSNDDLNEVKRRVFSMFMNSVQTIRLVKDNANIIFGERAEIVAAAINEYLSDFIDRTEQSGEVHPEVVIFERTSRESFQGAGFYGVQLDLKQEQLETANNGLIDAIATGTLGLIVNPFKKFIQYLNNFLFSFVKMTGCGEALKELKDCLLGELPGE